MRYELNLASKPFANTTILMLTVIAFVAAIAAFSLYNFSVFQASAEGGSYRSRIETAEERNSSFESRIKELDAELKVTDLAQLRSQILFADKLIERRNRSLSLMFDRLEEIFGRKQVRIRSLATRITDEFVTLRLGIEDTDDEALLLVDALKESRYFSGAYIKEESVLSDGTGKSWTLEVDYHFAGRE
jgi:hypothetical protein